MSVVFRVGMHSPQILEWSYFPPRFLSQLATGDLVLLNAPNSTFAAEVEKGSGQEIRQRTVEGNGIGTGRNGKGIPSDLCP